MTDEEASDAFGFLDSTVRETGLRWIAEQVAADIQLGRIAPKRVRVREREDGEFLFDVDIRKATNAVFVESVEYTNKERLELMLTALTRAISDVADLHQSTIENLDPKHLRLASDQPSPERILEFIDPLSRESRTISSEESRAKLAATSQKLRPLIDELKLELDGN